MKTKQHKIILSLILVGLGILLDGFAFTTKIGNPISTISLLIGLALVFGGFIYFIIGITSK